MKTNGFKILCPFASIIAIEFSGALGAVTNYYYVDPGSPAPAPPYTNWETAAHDIQSAVDQAQADVDVANGIFSEVIVTNGLYVVSQEILITLPIRLRSLPDDPATTVISGAYPASTSRCFFIAGEAWVSGFTVSNGYVAGAVGTNFGGGVYMTTNSAGRGGLLSNCRIVRNQARLASDGSSNGRGSGIYILGKGTVSNCLVQANFSNKAHGAGIFLDRGGDVVDSLILDNTGTTAATTYGGGIYASYGGTVLNCLIARNEARHAGGLMLDHGGIAQGCIISNNYAGNGKGAYLSYGGTLLDSIVEHNVSGYTTGTGGGIYIDRAGGFVDRCIVRYNAASSAAGIYHDRVTVRNTLVYGNQSSENGGGVVSTGFANTILENVTIVRNKASTAGGLHINVSSSAPYGGPMRNLICMLNEALETNNVALLPYPGYDLTNNNTFVFGCSDPIIPGAGNIADDPVFRDPGINAGLALTNGNFRLRANSPCRNSGTNLAWMAAATDLDRFPRLDLKTLRVDRGAYETPVAGGALLSVQ